MRLFKFLSFVLLTLLCLALLMAVPLFYKRKCQTHASNLLLHRWALWVLKLFKIHVSYNKSEWVDLKNSVMISNHLSYLDIPVLLSLGPCVFLGKQEIHSWPLIGTIARLSGMVSVKREQLKSRAQAICSLQERLREGHSILLFPEGTTSLEGPRRRTRPFYNGAFRVARMEGRKVNLFYLNYDQEERCAWIGDDDFVSHLWRFCGGGPVTVRIRQNETPVISSTHKQRAMARASRDWILEGGQNLGWHGIV